MNNKTNNLENKKVVRLPINSSKTNMQNKHFNYKTLALMTLYSNRQTEENFQETGIEEVYRYLYRNKIENHISDIEELTGLKENSIFRNIRKLIKEGKGLITTTITNKGDMIYRISYENESERKYVIIEEEILKLLINKADSNTIKAYIFLKYMCRNGARDIHRVYIAEQIGLSTNSESLKSISKITNKLEELRLIKKENKYKWVEKPDGNLQYTQTNIYKVLTYEQYLQLNNNDKDNNNKEKNKK